MVGSLLWSEVSTPQVTPSFLSQVFLQLRKQAINLSVSTFLNPPVLRDLGEGLSYLGLGLQGLALSGWPLFPRMALVNFMVVAARRLCSDLVPLGQQRWWQDPRWWQWHPPPPYMSPEKPRTLILVLICIGLISGLASEAMGAWVQHAWSFYSSGLSVIICCH